jgi:hypothetical protein
MQEAIGCITDSFLHPIASIPFVEVLISLVMVLLVFSSTGCCAALHYGKLV